ncbi:hypothetical protein PQR72_09750 [Paraburkholderia madseniana]|uniref:hypothetical protein n=1 Tax=Paraburkholderia madseniana TaxID=2599607 RepID=UPI001C13058D|nr:hypothetical protein [Paraburkholderia madseniana]
MAGSHTAPAEELGLVRPGAAEACHFAHSPCRATGVSWMLGIGRIGGIVGASIGGILLTMGWDFQLIFNSLAVPAALAAAAIGAMGIQAGKISARGNREASVDAGPDRSARRQT